MKPIKFPGHNVEFAKNQPQYLPLPAKYDRNDPNGAVTTQWELTPQEMAFVIKTGTIFITVLTFHNPLQPILASIFQPGQENQIADIPGLRRCPRCAKIQRIEPFEYPPQMCMAAQCFDCKQIASLIEWEKATAPVESGDIVPQSVYKELDDIMAEVKQKTGIIEIYNERCEQINKHGFNVEHDRKENEFGELKLVVAAIMSNDPDLFGRTGWSWDWWEKITQKSEREKLAVCGALLAAEIERITE